MPYALLDAKHSEFSKNHTKIPPSRLEQTPIIDKLDNTKEEFAIGLCFE
jgi:hypothetical protein